MLKRDSIKRFFRQILAIIEKELYLELRVKTQFVMRFVNPIIQILVLVFIFNLIFIGQKDQNFGYWNNSNFTLFLLLAFCINLSSGIMYKFSSLFLKEKYWKTLGAILISPVNRLTLLIGVLASELVIISIPLALFLLIAWYLYPINIFFVFLVLLVFFSTYLTFGSIGLFVSVYTISHEEVVPYLSIITRFLLLFGCVTYPIFIFPKAFQLIVVLNPLYYYFDLLRLVWYLGVDYENAIRYITPIHIITVVLITILSPIVSLYTFERIYKKYGIRGY